MDLKVRLRNAGSSEMISILDELVGLGQHVSKVQDELIDKIEEGVCIEPIRRLVEIAAKTRSSELLQAIQASDKIKLNSSAHAILLEAGFGQFEKMLADRIEKEFCTDPAGGWNWKQILNSLIKAGTQESTGTLEWLEGNLSDRIDSLNYKATNASDTPSGDDELFDPRYLTIYEEMLGLTRQALESASQRPHYESLNVVGDFVGLDDSYEAMIAGGESPQVEFKSTLRVNLHTGKPDNRMEHEVLKTIVAFMNSKGGTLFIGVNDDGEVIGLDGDNFSNEDKLLLHLDNLIKSKLGSSFFSKITTTISGLGSKRFLAVKCGASKEPVFLKNDKEEFYIRANASSHALPPSEMLKYIKEHFK